MRTYAVRHGRWISASAVLALLLLAPAGGWRLPVEGASAIQLEAQVGWSGWVPLSAWMPLRVDLSSTESLDAAVVVDVPLPGRDGVMSFRRPVRLGPVEQHRITMDILMPDTRRATTVRLVSGTRELARTELRVAPARVVEGVVLALTHDTAGLEFLTAFPQKLRPAYLTETDLPARWQDYDGVALLAIRDLDARVVSQAQQRAMETWVAQGGRLVVTGGERLVSLRAPWLLNMLPAIPAGLTRVSGAELPRGVRGPILAASLTPKPGASQRSPLIARWRWGAGAVTMWGFDAFAPEWRAWPGGAAEWGEALNAPVWPAVASRDLAAALPAGRPLPGGLQMGLAVLSLAYVVVARAALFRAGRVRSGWLAVPVVASLFALVTYGFALQARRAGTAVVQAAVVEGIPGTGAARVSSVVSLISPYGGTFRLEAPVEATVQPIEPAPLTFDGSGTISGSAPKTGLKFEVRQVAALAVEGRVDAGPEGLRLTISNRSGLQISGAMVFRGGQRYRLPRIGAQLSALLDPAGWEAAIRQPVPPPDTGDRLIEEVLARLQRRQSSPDVAAWLVGRIQDERLAVRGRPMQVESHQVLVLPLPAAEVPP